MAVIRIIPAGDLALNSSRTGFLWIDGGELIRQRIASRFRFFLGEWFLDRRQGVPWFRDVFKKNPDLRVVRSVFRQVLATTPGVISISRFDLQVDTVERTLYFDFEVQGLNGPVVVAPEDRDFILTF